MFLQPVYSTTRFTLTATVGGFEPTGTVTFKDGANTLGVASITDGAATIEVVAGLSAHTFTAAYGGDMNNLPVTSATLAVKNRIRGIDFDGDGKGDLLWRSAPVGPSVYEIWLMNGTTAATKSTGTLCGSGAVNVPGPITDLDGTGRSDYIVTVPGEGFSGTACLMQGVTSAGSGSLTGPGPYWGARWYADLDGDGKDDILWRNDGSDAVIPGEPPVTGAWKVGFMNGLEVISWSDLRPDNSGWEIAETGDFNGDGKADLLWQHEDGRVSLVRMNGATVLSELELRPAGNVWRVNFLADLNGDWKSDILWEQPDGSAVAWTMDGTTMLEEATLVGPGATGPYLSPAGDLDGDGMDCKPAWNYDQVLGVIGAQI